VVSLEHNFPLSVGLRVFIALVWRDNLDERRATIKLRMSRQK
jgi:hypothetical protein